MNIHDKTPRAGQAWPVARGRTRARTASLVALAALHAAALVILVLTESQVVPQTAFLLSWGFFNFAWIVMLRRPAVAAAIALACLGLLVVLSQLKHEVLLTTVNFIDLMLIDPDTATFLVHVFPNLDLIAVVTGLAGVLALIVLWRIDVLRPSRSRAAIGATACFAGLVGLSIAAPSDPWDEFLRENYFSKFMRSAVTITGDVLERGIFDKAPAGSVEVANAPEQVCRPERPPHIIMIHDESSFDARAIPGIKVPAGYGEHFKSFDGKARKLLVEGAGGPSWYTEYNVLTGLSGRSFGRLIEFVTRIAAGRVHRGLPRTLADCGYKTFTLYSMYGSFMSARRFQESTGIQHFLDSRALGAVRLEPDSFYFNAAIDVLKAESRSEPLFMLVYLAQNHFPWNFRFRPDLARDWVQPGNREDVDEYLRRQHLTAADYKAFVKRLEREFPDERFLIVRFGDHQPYFARHLIDESQNDSMLVRRIAQGDPRFLETYYAIDAINFRPRELGTALDRLDAPYLPLVILEAAGVPLDATFVEQKRILERCRGIFYRCLAGAEARWFNRFLIDKGLITGL